MAYVDTILTAAAGYTNIHTGQVYGALATALGGHTNWEQVDTIVAVNGTTSYYRNVWRCKAAGSGLPADFYVMFDVPFTTAGQYKTDWPVQIWLGESYSSGVMGKFASYNRGLNITPLSDLTNPETWTLSNFVNPSTSYMWGNQFGSQANVTTLRMIYVVATDHIIITRAGTTNSIIAATNVMYAGAYEPVMSSTDDPMPIVLFANCTSGSYAAGGFTRALFTTPGVPAAETFCAASYDGGLTTIVASNGCGRNPMNQPTGQPGTAATTTYWKNLGPTVSKCPLNSYLLAATDGATKGLFRGYQKDVVCASLAAHSFGDTFRVDGKIYAGVGLTGNAPLLNTQAT